MKSVYFGDKVINFASSGDLVADYSKQVPFTDELTITKVLQKLENNNKLWVVSNSCEELFSNFVSQFEVRQAGGGVVRNANGELLLIFRNGTWDLPKGHREAGETLEECAVREVTEECGIAPLECGRQIAVTFHTYKIGERWVLKECHWFDMRYVGSGILSPQTEEGIEQVVWMPLDRARRVVEENSYGTIKTVINSIMQ